MPITNVTFTFENGVKREEYGPIRKASATIIYALDDHENGEAVLAHIAHVARHRVQDAIGAAQPPPLQATPSEPDTAQLLATVGRADADIAPTPPATSAEAPADPATAENQGDAGAAPARRTRRTQAQIAADKAAEEAAKNPQSAAPTAEAGSDTSGSATTASTGSPAPTEPSPPASSPPSSDGPAAERIIDNAELTGACAAAAQRLGGIVAVKELIKEYTGRDPPLVADILSAKRQEFLDKLAALK